MLRSDFLHVLHTRGFINDCTNLEGLDTFLSTGQRTAYIGFDATAPSLHIGSLIQLMMLRWFQKCGHTPIALMGGGTTLVGDPSFRKDSRPMLSPTQITDNVASIQTVLEKVLNTKKTIVTNNADWLTSLNLLDFLRDTGTHFSINKMLAFDSVRTRLEANESLSFLEFNYMLLQAFDFLALHRTHDCRLQMGGSDQWGNIINGIDLIRRTEHTETFGLTSPLLTTASGLKMGKTAKGAVWLNETMLSSLDFWQFWRNIDDADVERFLLLFTELPIDEVNRLGALQGAEINDAKIILANNITGLLHTPKAAEQAFATAQSGGQDNQGMPTLTPTGNTLTTLLVESGLCPSGKAAKRSLQEGAIRIDGIPHLHTNTMLTDLPKQFVLTKGKKKHITIKQ